MSQSGQMGPAPLRADVPVSRPSMEDGLLDGDQRMEKEGGGDSKHPKTCAELGTVRLLPKSVSLPALNLASSCESFDSCDPMTLIDGLQP